MKRCDKCQERQATVHMTDISGMEIEDETHLCGECAETEGLQYNVELDLSDLVPEELDISELDELHDQEQELSHLECPDCGMTFEEFRETRKLGCPEDYEVFAPGLDPILEQIHDQLEHTGKVPSGVSESVRLKHEIQKHERNLQSAVSDEQFEEAADLRDRIESLQEERQELLEEEDREVDDDAADAETSGEEDSTRQDDESSNSTSEDG